MVMEDKGYCNKVSEKAPKHYLSICIFPSLRRHRKILQKGKFMFAFRHVGGSQRAYLLCFYYLPSTQKNPCAMMLFKCIL